MLKKGSDWFKNLSGAGKIGTLLAGVFSLLIIGSALANPESNNPEPSPSCEATTTTKTEVQPIPFTKTQANDPNLDKGKTAVSTAGVEGEKKITKEITTYSPDDCKASSTKTIKEEVTKQPVTEITSIGTKEPPPPAPAPRAASASSCSPYYSPCVPNVSYDLDCSDIGMRVSVPGADPYHLDADNDGVGCESY